jgi:archaemetzincin
MRIVSSALLMWLVPGCILLVSGMFAQFTPPTRAQRLAALGPMAGLPEALRLALQPGDDFQPVPEPGPNDWLANFAEVGQTFEQFVQSQPNRPDARRKKLYLQPLGDFSASDGPALNQLREFMAAFFMMEVDLLPPLSLAQTHLTSRHNRWTGQVQLLTGDILNLLQTRLPEDGFALLGITMTDLYPESSWNFVFGQASLRDRVGVYSFARYDPRFYGQEAAPDTRKLVLRRSCKVLAHETGHMFGIAHCVWYRCVMNGSNHLAEADARPLHLCPVDLRKLQWSIGFDVVERYRRLRNFDRRAGFEDEAHWLDQRLRHLAPHD